MLKTSKPVRMLIALAAVAASTFVAQFALPGTAQARCAGENNERTDVLKFAGVTYAQTEAIPGTCNGNTLYRGQVMGFVTGWQPVVYLQSSGNWSAHYGSTTPFVWQDFELDDTNTHSLFLICVTNGTDWICGDESNAVSGSAPVYKYHEDNDGY